MPFMDLEELRHELNPEQYRAVTTIDGALLIIAGAGSGKTRVITFRIANMLDQGIPQNAILALTFTNKAAKEMEERVKSLTGKKLQNLTVSTFHSFGVKILRANIERLGWRSNFSIYDDTDRNQLIKECGRELGYNSDGLDVYAVGNLISNVKIGRWKWGVNANEQYRPVYEKYQEGLKLYNAVDFDDLIGLPIKLFHEHPDVLERYRERFKYIMVDEFQDTSLQQYEFMHLIADKNVAVVGDDDQSIYSWRGANYENIRMFESDFPDVQEIRLEQNYRSTETILAAANGVISHNTNRKDKSLWSGNGSGKPIEIYMPENEADEADFIAETIQGICMEEKRHYDDFGVLIRANTLSRAIEEAFLECNIPYTMSGGTSFFQRKEIKDVISYLRVCANHDDDINLLRIINTPRRGLGRGAIEQFNSIAEAKDCSLWEAIEHLIKYFSGYGVGEAIPGPDELTGAGSNTLSGAGGASAASDDDSWFTNDDAAQSDVVARAASRLGSKSLADLEMFHNLIVDQTSALLSGNRGLSKKVRALLDAIDYRMFLSVENPKSEKAAQFKWKLIEEDLLQGIDTWENNPDNFDTGLYAYLNRITLLSQNDDDDDSLKGKVNLMTIHASKGLEFPVVFIAGCEDGIIPHARSLEDADGGGIEEERRLFYVAITRARDKLFLSCCHHRKHLQQVAESTPSPFLDEIPANLVEYHEPQTEVTSDKLADMLEMMKMKFAPDTPEENA